MQNGREIAYSILEYFANQGPTFNFQPMITKHGAHDFHRVMGILLQRGMIVLKIVAIQSSTYYEITELGKGFMLGLNFD
ncbi:MAG: hypothetical protein FD179_1019 [Erysipelotrichaceae bacterium]|nr:MAG: hypothetical protein FD179_1019 [Erysipelotrichaceae bacterium]